MAEISGTEALPGKRFAAGMTREELKAWVEGVLRNIG
jgi:hypothetical protein